MCSVFKALNEFNFEKKSFYADNVHFKLFERRKKQKSIDLPLSAWEIKKR